MKPSPDPRPDRPRYSASSDTKDAASQSPPVDSRQNHPAAAIGSDEINPKADPAPANHLSGNAHIPPHQPAYWPASYSDTNTAASADCSSPAETAPPTIPAPDAPAQMIAHWPPRWPPPA